MTDSMPESTWSEPAPTPRQPFWESSGPPSLQECRATSPSARASRRPAAALGADVHALLESMARKRVPRLDAVRVRLQKARGGLDLAGVDSALQQLQAATTGLDFLAVRGGGDAAGVFVVQGAAFTLAAANFGELSTAFIRRHGTEGAVARLMWIDLVLESGSLHKRVRQGAHWLAEMDRDLIHRRKGPNTAVTLRAIDELSRRAQAMHERLHIVHRLCGHARRVHSLSERQAGERTGLCDMLREQVLPATRTLGEALQPLVHAATWRPLLASELLGAVDARHALEVALTQGAAQIARLQQGDQELASELACMEEKAAVLG